MHKKISNKHQINNGKFSHLLGLDGLNQSQLFNIIHTAEQFIVNNRIQQNNALDDLVVANLFFEPSTRTRNTFELAARRCGATVINIDLENSATKKNESLFDTIQTLEEMQIDMLVIRHRLNGLPHKIAKQNNSIVINAGDGTNAHPTQGLLDILTIYQKTTQFEQLSIAIVGDIKHSRVAHSDICALLTLGVKDIRLISPKELSYPYHNCPEVSQTDNIAQGIKDVDFIIILRLQKERMLESDIPNEASYFQSFGLTKQRLALAKPNAFVMHPGPINREVEIASDVADSQQSLILQQVKNGIAVRMATMFLLNQAIKNNTSTI